MDNYPTVGADDFDPDCDGCQKAEKVLEWYDQLVGKAKANHDHLCAENDRLQKKNQRLQAQLRTYEVINGCPPPFFCNTCRKKYIARGE
jgi:hypothetical protein